jgi:hypothetical protein
VHILSFQAAQLLCKKQIKVFIKRKVRGDPHPGVMSYLVNAESMRAHSIN